MRETVHFGPTILPKARLSKGICSTIHRRLYFADPYPVEVENIEPNEFRTACEIVLGVQMREDLTDCCILM